MPDTANRSRSHRRRQQDDDVAAVPNWYDTAFLGVAPIAAFQPKGAADYATSLQNLVSPGTYNVAPLTGAPTFDTSQGWIGKTGCTGLQVADYTTSGGIYTVIVRVDGTSNYRQYVDTSTPAHFTISARAAGASWFVIQQNDVVAGRTGVWTLSSKSGTDEEAGYLDGSKVSGPFSIYTPADGLAFNCGPLTTADQILVAVAWYAQRLTPAQIATLTTAIQAL